MLPSSAVKKVCSLPTYAKKKKTMENTLHGKKKRALFLYHNFSEMRQVITKSYKGPRTKTENEQRHHYAKESIPENYATKYEYINFNWLYAGTKVK